MIAKTLKQQKGVTLVALGVTILILMVIAGITISALTSDHGVVDQATNAQMQTAVGQLQETLDVYVKGIQMKKVNVHDRSRSTIEGELTGNNIVTRVKSTEGLNLGVFKTFNEIQFKTDLGEGGKNIDEKWSGSLQDLEDCFAIDFKTNDVYYIKDGYIWQASGMTTAEEVKEHSENAPDPSAVPTPTTKPSTEPSTNPSTTPSTEPSTQPTTPVEEGTKVDVSFAYYDATNKGQKIEGKEVTIPKGESSGVITPPTVSEIQIEVNGEQVTAKPRGWSRSTDAKAEVEIEPGNTLTVTEADNRKTYYMSYEYVSTVEYTKPDGSTGEVQNKTYVDSSGNTQTEEGKIPEEDTKPKQDLQDNGWDNGKGDGQDKGEGGSGVDKDKDIWTTDPDHPDDKSKWVDPTDPDTKVEGQVYPVYTKEITVNRKIYKNQEHDEGPITALMYRSIEEDTIKAATVELGTANNATITQDANGNDLDTEVEAEPRFWTTNEAANVEDTTGSNSDATKDETEVALNGKAHLTKNTTYYMLYKYTSTVTYGIPKAEGEGEDTEEKQREIYVNANGTIEGQEVQTPDQPTAPSTWQPSPESWQWNGWNKEETPSDKAVNPDDIVEKEVTLHASFKRDITINFDADGGEAESVPEAITAQSYKNALNEVPAKVTIPEKTPTYGERNFLHWTDKAEEEPQTYEKNQEYEFTEDKTLYAVWDNMGAEVDPNVRPDDPEKVIKYKTVDGAEEEWLPFYNDGTYNYIISKNYIDPQVEGVLNSISGLKYANDGRYPRGINWGGIAPSCAGQPQNNNIADIKTTGFWKRYEFDNTSNNNSKMAYSFLNKDWWTQFKGEYGTDAIGTVTLEMYATAYNARYKDKNIAWTNENYGLKITNFDWNNDEILNTSDDTFVIEEKNQCTDCWLASPLYNDNRCLWNVTNDRHFNGTGSSANYLGLRPVVRLKRGTKIIDKGDHYELEYTPSETGPEPVNPNEMSKEDQNKTLTYENDSGVTEWMPYYFDGTYNYIITKDYIDPQIAEQLKSETGLQHAKSDSSPRAVNSKEQPPAGIGQRQTNNLEGAKTKGFWRRYEFDNTTNTNAIMVYTFLNTSYWSQYVSEHAKDAIGTATLEMFATAYNARYKDKNITWNNGQYGLNILNSEYGKKGFLNENDDTFVINENDQCYYCWLASPAYTRVNDIWSIDRAGYLYPAAHYNNDCGLRPIVRLKAGVKIVKDANDNLSLDYSGEYETSDSINPNEMSEEDQNKTLTYENDSGVTEWMPYYFDGTYNYLITKDYIDPQGQDVEKRLNPESKLTWANNSSYPRGIYWTDETTSYLPETGQSQNTNRADIKTSGFWKRYEYNNTSKINSKMAYTFLNENWWTQYKGEYGADAIGTPTLEMFMTAYKSRYPSKVIDYNASGTHGLQITTSGYDSNDFLDRNDDTFVIAENNQCYHCWLASPYYSSDTYLWLVDYNGYFGRWYLWWARMWFAPCS